VLPDSLDYVILSNLFFTSSVHCSSSAIQMEMAASPKALNIFSISQLDENHSFLTKTFRTKQQNIVKPTNENR